MVVALGGLFDYCVVADDFCGRGGSAVEEGAVFVVEVFGVLYAVYGGDYADAAGFGGGGVVGFEDGGVGVGDC